MSSQLKLSAYGALATMATSLSLLSVFATTAWIVPVMVAIVLVAACCALVRMSPLPSAFEPIFAAVAVLLWVTIIDAHSKAHLGVIPGRLAFSHLGHVARNGFTEIHRLPTPAPAHHGLVLLTVVGVAAIALVVDLLTVTLRRAALSGLPLLALFTVCAATGHHGVGIFPFIVASVGYLWLLYADNREKVARWGAAVGTGKRARPASAWSTDAASAPAPASLGRQVGAVAISLGLVVPLFIPGLHTGIGKNGNGSGSGGSGTGGSVRTFDPLVRIGADLSTSTAEPVLSYRTSSQDPTYLRMTSLDVFNGSSFSLPQLTASAKSEASEQLPVAPPPGPVVTTSVDIAPKFDVRWLPVVSTALGVSVGDEWRYDPGTATIFSAATDTEGLQYSVRSVVNQPTAAELASAPAPDQAHDADMILTNISPAVKALTRRVTAGATSRYAAALDIERFFTGGKFTYDTSIPPDHSAHALDDFLLRNRRGFCQQFAAAMAVMARLKGIPSRVAVGFTRGKQQANGSWSVTTHDAHAWPELWFQGFGWLPFEPTPRADGQAVTPTYAKPVTHSGGPNRHHKQHHNGSSGPGRTPAGLLKKPPGAGTSGSAGSAGGGGGSASSSRIALALWILALIAAVALVVPGTARVITRQRRSRRLNDPAEAAPAAWAELRDTAIDLRVPWDDRRSPRQVATGLTEILGAAPEVRESLLGIVRCEEESRYAPVAKASRTELRRDLGVVRSAAAATCSRPQRVLAWLMPRSTVLTGRALLSRAANRVEGVTRGRTPIRRTLRRVGLVRT